MNKSNWLRSASWDSLWIMSGLWLFPLGAFFYYSQWSDSFINYLFLAAPIIGGLHSFLPLIATFSSPGFAERMRPQKKRIVKMSVIIVVVSFVLSVAGGVFSRPELWLLLGYGYLLWNTWHFAAQNFGVLSLYRSTSEQNSVLERKVDKFYCVTMGCVIMPLSWFCVEARWGPFVNMFPDWIPVKVITIATIAAALVMTVAYIFFELQKKNRSLQKIAYVLSIGVQPFSALWSYYPFHFLAYTIPHWMVEIGITGTIQTKEAQRSTKVAPLMVVGSILVLSMILIYFLEMPLIEDGYVLTWWEQLANYDVPIDNFYTQFTIPALISFLVVPRSFFHFYISRQVFKSTRWTLGMLKAQSEAKVSQTEKCA